LATEVRAAEKSLESVAAVLGHSNVSTSEIYAERNLGLAIDIMRRLG
jgi:site-specific recombinase XerC